MSNDPSAIQRTSLKEDERVILIACSLLHSTAGGGLKGAHNGLVHASQDAGMWKLIATNSWPLEEKKGV